MQRYRSPVGNALKADLESLDLHLPLFVYGALKPGEIAHSIVATFPSRPAVARGDLPVRDGVALFDPAGHKAVRGAAIEFGPDPQQGYEAVATYEPDRQYGWLVVDLLEPVVQANVLAGIDPARGSVHLDDPVWRSSDDPAFKEALEFVGEVAATDAAAELVLLHADAWRRFFRIQAAYLLLWSIIERLALLAYGPELSARDKSIRLASDPDFAVFLRRRLEDVSLDPVIYDVKDPRMEINLSDDQLGYLRQIRHNLIHRGKTASRDGERVRLALRVLAPTLADYLDIRRRSLR